VLIKLKLLAPYSGVVYVLAELMAIIPTIRSCHLHNDDTSIQQLIVDRCTFPSSLDYFYSKVAVEGMLLFIMAIDSQLAVTQIAQLDGNGNPCT
jgi:hypothetical protein